jgi:hypothetical protein
MTTFTEDFQRRLRAVLAKRTGREIPADAKITINADGASYGEDSSLGMDLSLDIRASGPVHAEYTYDEPGAWPRLLADLEAVDTPPPLDVLAADMLVQLNDQGGRMLPDNDAAKIILAGRDLIARHGDHWYITPGGREVAAEIKAAGAPKTPPRAFVRVERHSSIPGAASSEWWAWDELGTRYLLQFAHGIGTVRAVVQPGGDLHEVRRFEQGTSSHITLDAFAHRAGIDVSQIPEEQRR